MAMNAGDADPRAEGHARQVPDRPLRGRLGRLQPDPHRRGVRAAGRAARAILHGLWTMAQVARAQTEAGGGPAAASSASRCSSAAWACPSRRSRSPAPCARSRDGARDGRHASPSRTASRSSATPRPSCASAERRQSSPRIRCMLTPRQELILRKVVEGYLRPGSPSARRRSPPTPTSTAGPSTIRNELALLEEHGPARAPAHLGRPRADRRRATATSSTACCAEPRPRRERAARALAHAPRGRRGDARHHRDALAGHEPAGDRLRAADRHRDDPPRRGARCCSRRC